MNTVLLDKTDINQVCEMLNHGGVVAFPTDTVYGVAVVFDKPEAIQAMKIAKGRDEGKPFPMMVSDVSQIDSVAWINSKYRSIMNALMPGALTIVVKKKDSVGDFVTNGKDTIAIRIPNDDFVRDVIRQVGKPLLVTSANLSGGANTTNEQEVLAQLDGRIEAVVRGQSESTTASTIIDLTQDEYKILRQGVITKEMIDRI